MRKLLSFCIAAVFAVMAMLSATTTVFAADAQPPTVSCKITGRFNAPQGVNLSAGHVYYDYQPEPKDVSPEEEKSYHSCHAKNRFAQIGVGVYFPVTNTRGPLMVKLTVIACTTGGGYVFSKKLKPSANYEYTFKKSDFRKKGDSKLQGHC